MRNFKVLGLFWFREMSLRFLCGAFKFIRECTCVVNSLETWHKFTGNPLATGTWCTLTGRGPRCRPPVARLMDVAGDSELSSGQRARPQVPVRPLAQTTFLESWKLATLCLQRVTDLIIVPINPTGALHPSRRLLFVCSPFNLRFQVSSLTFKFQVEHSSIFSYNFCSKLRFKWK